jgi:uncharacterized membrane protein YkvA (DUF1232 family)
MNVALTSELARYLADMSRPGREASPSRHIERGAACVLSADLAALPHLRPALEAKLARIAESDRLKSRLSLLLQYLDEMPAHAGTACQKEAAFAVFYFLKGFDLIPDSVPGIGLLDDALLVETVLRRNAHELREHWAAHGRPGPALA